MSGEDQPKRFSVTLELVVEGVDDQLTAEEVVHAIYKVGVAGVEYPVVITWDSVSSGLLIDTEHYDDGSTSQGPPGTFVGYEDDQHYYCARGHHAVTKSQLAEGRDERGFYWCTAHADPKPVEHER